MTTSDPSVIQRAADMGIIHFDTARSYQGGNNERMVGAALKDKRKQLIISSKSGGKTKQEVLAHLDTSLKELGTDYLDIWYLHNRSTPAEAPDELFEAQQEAKKAGKIRFAGLSSHYNMDQMMEFVVKKGQTDVFLTTYNFAMQNVALDGQAARVVDMGAAIQKARKAGLGIVVMKALAGGASRASRGDRLYGAASDAVVKTLAQEGAPVAAIKWVLKNQSVDTTIVCMTDQDQLEQNVLAMASPYSPSDEKLLNQRLASISPYYCRMCGTCGGVCDKGVPVPDMLRYVTYAEGYGQFAMAREKFLEHSAEVRSIRCKDCGSCSIDCPYGVQVRDRLMHAQDLFA
jgi:predicted aldo/keto reductase-like oxidoreductase